MTTPSVNWNYPTAVKVGPGRIRELPDWCKSLGMQRPLLVTDPGLAPLPMVAETLARCRAAKLDCASFHDIKGNPTGRNVEAGVTAFKAGRHDGVIAFGGGSALDAAKAVPTTAGTGSEVGRASVILDEDAKLKRIIFHARMLPAVVILDAELSVSLPPKITAATGMDALSHNLEAYCSPFHHPMAAGIALEGIRLVHDFLPRAHADGNDLEARQQMLVASAMGATAFQRGLGAMHALAHPLGALYDAHHGLLNAILMPYVLQANAAAIGPRIAALARYLDLPHVSFDGFLVWVLELRTRLGIPGTLREIGIDENDAEQIGRMAIADGSAATNPVAFTAQQYEALLRNAVRGTL